MIGPGWCHVTYHATWSAASDGQWALADYRHRNQKPPITSDSWKGFCWWCSAPARWQLKESRLTRSDVTRLISWQQEFHHCHSVTGNEGVGSDTYDKPIVIIVFLQIVFRWTPGQPGLSACNVGEFKTYFQPFLYSWFFQLITHYDRILLRSVYQYQCTMNRPRPWP